MRRQIINSDTSPFLGIGVGKKAKAKAQAKIDIINAQAAADAAKAKLEADSLSLRLAAAQQGYDPQKEATAAEVKKTETTANTQVIMYVAIAAAVLGTMYFVFKK